MRVFDCGELAETVFARPVGKKSERVDKKEIIQSQATYVWQGGNAISGTKRCLCMGAIPVPACATSIIQSNYGLILVSC